MDYHPNVPFESYCEINWYFLVLQEKHLSVESTDFHGQDEEFRMLAETEILPRT